MFIDAAPHTAATIRAECHMLDAFHGSRRLSIMPVTMQHYCFMISPGSPSAMPFLSAVVYATTPVVAVIPRFSPLTRVHAAKMPRERECAAQRCAEECVLLCGISSVHSMRGARSPRTTAAVAHAASLLLTRMRRCSRRSSMPSHARRFSFSSSH